MEIAADWFIKVEFVGVNGFRVYCDYTLFAKGNCFDGEDWTVHERPLSDDDVVEPCHFILARADSRMSLDRSPFERLCHYYVGKARKEGGGGGGGGGGGDGGSGGGGGGGGLKDYSGFVESSLADLNTLVEGLYTLKSSS